MALIPIWRRCWTSCMEHLCTAAPVGCTFCHVRHEKKTRFSDLWNGYQFFFLHGAVNSIINLTLFCSNGVLFRLEPRDMCHPVVELLDLRIRSNKRLSCLDSMIAGIMLNPHPAILRTAMWYAMIQTFRGGRRRAWQQKTALFGSWILGSIRYGSRLLY